MYTNADITLYLYNKEGKNEKYTRHPVKAVYWEDVEQSTFQKTGQRDACNALVMIPLSSVQAPIRFTRGKDKIIKGLVEEEIDCSSPAALSQSLEQLRTKHRCLTVISVDERLYGSSGVQHYQLACK